MKLTIEGVPISQARMKFSSHGGFGRLYDPKEKEKNKLKKFLSAKYNGKLLEFPRVSFVFHMPIPKSTPKKLLHLYNSGLLKHTKKPDCDNFIKLYLDCMDGITYHGDQKVSLGPCIKLYHPQPKTLIFINDTSNLLTPQEIDPEVYRDLFSVESDKCSSSEMVSPLDLDNLCP